MNIYLKLLYCILCDLFGYVSFVIPGIGEFSDIIWAPLSGWIMTKLFPGKIGKIAGWVSFIEEALPVSDVIPTFTLTWLYTYVFNSTKKHTSGVKTLK